MIAYKKDMEPENMFPDRINNFTLEESGGIEPSKQLEMSDMPEKSVNPVGVTISTRGLEMIDIDLLRQPICRH